MIKRLVALFFGLSMLLLSGAILVGGWLVYARMTAEGEPARFSYSRERPLELEAAALRQQDVTPTIEVYGQIVSGREQGLSFEVAGVIAEMSEVARLGGNIRKGEAIARLKIDDSSSTAANSRLGVDEAEVRLAQVESQIAVAQKEVAAIQRAYDLAADQFDARKRLASRGFLSQNALASEEQALINSRGSLDSRLAALADLDNQRRLAELARDRAQLTQASAEGDLAALTLVAPADGFLSASELAVGQSLSPTSVVARFTAADDINAQFRLPFSDYGRLLADPAVDGNPEKLLGRKAVITWQLGSNLRSYQAEVVRVDRAAVTDAASVRLAARLQPVPFTDPLVLGAQVLVALEETALSGVFLVDERSLSPDNRLFALVDDRLQEVVSQRLGYVDEQVAVRGDFAGAVGYAPIRTRQMFNGAKVRVSNPQVLTAPIPAAGGDQIARLDDPAAAPADAKAAPPAPPPGEAGGRPRGPGFLNDPNVEMVTLDADQQKALVAQVKRSRMPDSLKQRIIPQIESGKVPAPMLEMLSNPRRPPSN